MNSFNILVVTLSINKLNKIFGTYMLILYFIRDLCEYESYFINFLFYESWFYIFENYILKLGIGFFYADVCSYSFTIVFLNRNRQFHTEGKLPVFMEFSMQGIWKCNIEESNKNIQIWSFSSSNTVEESKEN